MPVPKQRHNTARKGRRRAGQTIKIKKIVKVQAAKCSNCDEKILSHRACPKCGFYKGREIIKTAKKTTKKNK